jgi:hypothetical protein
VGVLPFLPSCHGLHYANSWPDVPDLTLHTPLGAIGIGSAANGLCGGMIFAARDLWEGRRLPPPAERPAPNSPAFAYLVRRLFDSFHLPSGVAQYYAWMNLPRHDLPLGPRGTSSRTITTSLPALRRTIDSGVPCPLGLVCVRSPNPGTLGRNHQVLAYGYEVTGSAVTVRVYDGNWPDRDDVTLEFDVSAPSAGTDFRYSTADREIFGFFPVRYRPRDPAPLWNTAPV